MSYYCERIDCNCKYCDEEDGCIFYSQGSGNVIDMPCYEDIEENMRPATEEEHQSTLEYIRKKRIKTVTLTPLWLTTFNTNSATECFTAVQELKKRLGRGDADEASN